MSRAVAWWKVCVEFTPVCARVLLSQWTDLHPPHAHLSLILPRHVSGGSCPLKAPAPAPQDVITFGEGSNRVVRGGVLTSRGCGGRDTEGQLKDPGGRWPSTRWGERPLKKPNPDARTVRNRTSVGGIWSRLPQQTRDTVENLQMVRCSCRPNVCRLRMH